MPRNTEHISGWDFNNNGDLRLAAQTNRAGDTFHAINLIEIYEESAQHPSNLDMRSQIGAVDMNLQLKGKTAIVTDGSAGIGLAAV